MISGYENKKLKINVPLAGHVVGSILTIKVDRNGTPLDQYWRRRLTDAEVDGCVEFVSDRKKNKGDK